LTKRAAVNDCGRWKGNGNSKFAVIFLENLTIFAEFAKKAEIRIGLFSILIENLTVP
jgi:hypothetical protein